MCCSGNSFSDQKYRQSYCLPGKEGKQYLDMSVQIYILLHPFLRFQLKPCIFTIPSSSFREYKVERIRCIYRLAFPILNKFQVYEAIPILSVINFGTLPSDDSFPFIFLFIFSSGLLVKRLLQYFLCSFSLCPRLLACVSQMISRFPFFLTQPALSFFPLRPKFLAQPFLSTFEPRY